MQKILIWLQLNIKSFLKSRVCYISIFLMIFMCLIFNSLKQENNSNTLQVGYYTGENAINEKIIERLKEVSGYNYIAYESEHELKNDIIKEKILCGFIIDIGDIRKTNFEELIDYYSLPLCAEGEVIKEDVYSAFYYVISDYIIANESPDLFEESDDELVEQIVNRKNEYLESNYLFSINIIEEGRLEIKNTENTGSVAIKYIIYICIFMITFMMYGKRYEDRVRIRLPHDLRIKYDFCYLIAVGLPITLSGYLLLGFMEKNWFSLFGEIALVFVYGIIWSVLIGGLIKNKETYISVNISLFLILMIICPVIIDISDLIRPIVYIRYLFPPSIF